MIERGSFGALYVGLMTNENIGFASGGGLTSPNGRLVSILSGGPCFGPGGTPPLSIHSSRSGAVVIHATASICY